MLAGDVDGDLGGSWAGVVEALGVGGLVVDEELDYRAVHEKTEFEWLVGGQGDRYSLLLDDQLFGVGVAVADGEQADLGGCGDGGVFGGF